VFTDGQPIPEAAALKFVLVGQPMLQNAGPEGQFYFDFDLTESKMIPARRLHGWADKATKRVVQWG
jgi:hypothetical protein